VEKKKKFLPQKKKKKKKKTEPEMFLFSSTRLHLGDTKIYSSELNHAKYSPHISRLNCCCIFCISEFGHNSEVLINRFHIKFLPCMLVTIREIIHFRFPLTFLLVFNDFCVPLGPRYLCFHCVHIYIYI